MQKILSLGQNLMGDVDVMTGVEVCKTDPVRNVEDPHGMVGDSATCADRVFRVTLTARQCRGPSRENRSPTHRFEPGLSAGIRQNRCSYTLNHTLIEERMGPDSPISSASTSNMTAIHRSAENVFAVLRHRPVGNCFDARKSRDPTPAADSDSRATIFCIRAYSG